MSPLETKCNPYGKEQKNRSNLNKAPKPKQNNNNNNQKTPENTRWDDTCKKIYIRLR